MGLVQNLEPENVKEPFFDHPDDLDPSDLRITQGTRVALSYHGKQLSAQVAAIERLGTAFVGRVLGFGLRDERHDDLARGDFVRFRQRDVLWTE